MILQVEYLLHQQVVVQIVDARNPLLFRCEDLERYVHEIGKEKLNVILINKADFLSEKQRQTWAKYFDRMNLPVAFFSALEENQNHRLQNLAIDEEDELESLDGEEEEESEAEDAVEDDTDYKEDPEAPLPQLNEENQEEVRESSDEAPQPSSKTEAPPIETSGLKNSSRLLSRGELIGMLKTIHTGTKVQENRTVVGLVGYPNVGKSSTINSLLTYKKVSVSATPGKTKHFQVTS